MNTYEKIQTMQGEFSQLRHWFHQHPELSMHEFETSAKVAELLKSWGIEVHEGVGGTGVVGVLRNGDSDKSIALRADMDALPVPEANHFEHASQNAGKMHACGHDGHTTALLMAARYLAETKDFNGTVNFVFQPGEENTRGAQAMIDDGLIERFPADFYIGCHNWPDTPADKVGATRSAIMSASNTFQIRVDGCGSHGAMPNLGIDPVFVLVQIYQALQGIITRKKRPIDAAVMSICKIEAGTADNIVPNFATMHGTMRCFSDSVTDLVEDNMRAIASGIAAGFGAKAEVIFKRNVSAVINTPEVADLVIGAATELFGADMVHDQEPAMPSEDFSVYLKHRPGCFFFLGNGKGEHRASGHGEGPCALHNPSYDYNDAILPRAAAVFAKVAENYLK